MTTAPGGPVPREVLIGLDVGTTATKAAAFSLDPAAPGWVYLASADNQRLDAEPGRYEQDPAQLLAGVGATIKEAVAAAEGAHVTGVSLSTAMHSLIGLDSQGEPVTPLITWADSRAVAQAHRLRDSSAATGLYRRSGSPVHAMTPLTKLMWFNETEPELARRVRVWVGLKDLIIRELTGHLVTEASSASGTGLWDLTTGWWNPQAVALAGIDLDQLPAILPTTAGLPMTGTFASAVGLLPGTPVVVGAGDGPLGNLGTRALHPGEIGLSVGTSGALRMVVDEPLLDPDGRLFCYALTDQQWVVGGAVSSGGAAVSWVNQLLYAEPDATSIPQLLDAAASVPAGAHGLVMLPYLLSERAPLWDAELAGAYLGLKAHHSRAHFARATVEGVALQLAAVFEQINALHPVESVHATGGVFRSTLWQHVIAAALNRPLTITASGEGTALGAAALGLYALGRAPDLVTAVDQLHPATTVGQVTPDPNDAATYRHMQAAIPVMLRAYNEVAELFASLAPS